MNEKDEKLFKQLLKVMEDCPTCKEKKELIKEIKDHLEKFEKFTKKLPKGKFEFMQPPPTNLPKG